MNERIKKLAEQAGMSDDKYGMFFAKDKHDEDGVDLEKFAELIVQECMTVARGADGLDATHEAWYLIKEHFGVE
jgi:hypothetical protein